MTGYRTERLPLDQSGESQTLDTMAASRRLLGTFTDARYGGLHFWTQPNSWHHFMSDHIVTFSAIPVSPETTLLRTKWLVHKDAVEGVDYDVRNLTAVWEATNRQDAHLVELAQTGRAQPRLRGRPVLALHRRPGREIQQLVHRPAGRRARAEAPSGTRCRQRAGAGTIEPPQPVSTAGTRGRAVHH